jgi:hypothetical protein
VNCEVCPVDRVAQRATKRVAFAPTTFGPRHGVERHADVKGDVFFTCDGCAAAAINTVSATITDIPQEAPNGN